MKKSLIVITVFSLFLAVFLMFGCETSYVKGAKLYIGQNNFEKARENLEKNIKEYPSDPTAYYWLGIVDGQEGKWDDMIEHFDQCLAISNTFSGKIADMKKQYYNDFYSQGINKYNDVVKLLKEKEVDENEIKGILNEVIATQEMALKMDPMSEKPSEILSRAFLLLGEQDKAKELFERLLTENPNHASALSVLGNIYYEDGINKEDNEALKKSIELHERLVEIQPDNPRALRELALGYYQMGDSLKALQKFETAIQTNPDNGNLHLNYGKILYETGNKEKAELEFKKSLELMPNNIPALRSLTRFYVVDVKDYEKGLEPLKNLVEIDPQSANNWELLGICEANLGHKEEAEAAFKKAEELRKASP